MSIYDKLEFNSTVSFDVYPSSIIGAQFRDVKVTGFLDRDTAAFWIDPESMHINVYPTLPSGVPDDPSQYTYVKLKHPNGNISVIGLPWIREDTIQTTERGRLKIEVEDVGPRDQETIRKALAANGYRAAKVTLE